MYPFDAKDHSFAHILIWILLFTHDYDYKQFLTPHQCNVWLAALPGKRAGAVFKEFEVTALFSCLFVNPGCVSMLSFTWAETL